MWESLSGGSGRILKNQLEVAVSGDSRQQLKLFEVAEAATGKECAGEVGTESFFKIFKDLGRVLRISMVLIRSRRT